MSELETSHLLRVPRRERDVLAVAPSVTQLDALQLQFLLQGAQK